MEPAEGRIEAKPTPKVMAMAMANLLGLRFRVLMEEILHHSKFLKS